MKILFTIAGSVVAVFILSSQAPNAGAAEIKVLSGLGIKAVMEDLRPTFGQTTGHRLSLTYAPLGALVKLVQGGEEADVIIIPQQGMESLANGGKIVAGSVRVVARSGMALAVRKGAPKPDISSAEALKRTLLAARSITYGRGAGSEHFQKVLERLGIANDVRSKTIRGEPGDTGIRVANGEAEIGVSLFQILAPVAGIEIVGPLPGDLQDTLVFSAAVMVGARDATVSKVLIDFLRSPEGSKTIRTNGLDPG